MEGKMPVIELPLILDIRTGNRNSEDIMREYDLTRSELNFLCGEFQREGKISAEDLTRITGGVDRTSMSSDNTAFVTENLDHNPDDDKRKRRDETEESGWGNALSSVGDTGMDVGRSTASSAGAMNAAAMPSVLDATLGADVADAASGAADLGEGVLETVRGAADVGSGVVEVVGDVLGGVVEVVGEVLGSLSD